MKQKKYSSDLKSILTDTERQSYDDQQWALNDSAVCEKYSGKVIAVCDKKVVAAAKTITQLNEKMSRLDKDDPLRYRLVVVNIQASASR